MKKEYGLAIVGAGPSAIHVAKMLGDELGKKIIIVSGEEAEQMNSLKSIRNIPIEIPVIKHNMPEMTGREKRRERRKQQRKRK